MKLNKVRFGDYIKIIKDKCNISNLTPNDVSGINREKEFFEPSKQVSNDTSNYKIVPPNCFACNIMHVGRDIVLPIALNTTNKNKIVSPAYTVFEWTGESVILKEYLFIMLKSHEMDRYFWFHCDSSVRDGMDWDAFCDIELDVPSIDIQKKYIAIYEAMLVNLHSYQKGLDDLKLTLEILFDKNKSINKTPLKNIFKINNRNNEGFKVNYTCLRGINENCELGATRDSVKPNQVDKYRLIPVGSFAINFMCLGNFGKFYLAYNDTSTDVIVSPACNGFDLLSNEVDPYYLVAYLRRTEFQRRCVFCGAGNTRGGINFDDFAALEIGLPSKTIQESIGKIYRLYDSRRKNAEFLKNKITTLCPILIRGSILEAEGDN